MIRQSKRMFLLSLLVFINLFLIPIVLHPFAVCRHFIHIGHEPFHPKPLRAGSYESSMDSVIEQSRSLMSSWDKQDGVLQRFWHFLLRSHRSNLSRSYYYPNLFDYTAMYLRDHDFTPFLRSFLFMSLAHFLLVYCSSLVHVYRMSSSSPTEIRHRAKRWIESSYVRWIGHALYWKSLGVLCSHLFYVLAVKIIMQSLFISYGHFQLEPTSIYSWWNVKTNLQLIYQYEDWTSCFTGLLSRMIYELGQWSRVDFSIGHLSL